MALTNGFSDIKSKSTTRLSLKSVLSCANYGRKWSLNAQRFGFWHVQAKILGGTQEISKNFEAVQPLLLL